MQAEAIRSIARAQGIPFADAAAYFRLLFDVPVPTNIKVGALRAAQAGLVPVPTSTQVCPNGDEAECALAFDGITATERRRELARLNPDWDEHVARQVDWLLMIAAAIEDARARQPYIVLLQIVGVLAALRGSLRAEHEAAGRVQGIAPLARAVVRRSARPVRSAH